MANLLSHALFALALFSIPSSLLYGTPLTSYGFAAALASLAPDLERRGAAVWRTPYGHSVAYGLLWALLTPSILSVAAWTSLLPPWSLHLLIGAWLTGLASHLLLDALREPGIFTWPLADGHWGRFAAFRRRRTQGLNLVVSSFSIGTILTLAILY